MRFELTFEDPVRLRWRHWHATIKSAEVEVERVYNVLDRRSLARPRFTICDGDGRIVGSTLIARLAERLDSMPPLR
jgi:hypothetical protein